MSLNPKELELAEQQLTSVRYLQPDGSVLVVGGGIRFRVQVLKPGFVLMTGSGSRATNADDTDADAEVAMLKELDAELQRAGQLTVFSDLRDMSRMATHSREIAANWMRTNRGKLKGAHVLVRSKLVEMAMSIVAMLVGGGILKLYSSPQVFIDLIRETAPNFLELPVVYKHALTGS